MNNKPKCDETIIRETYKKVRSGLSPSDTDKKGHSKIAMRISIDNPHWRQIIMPL